MQKICIVIPCYNEEKRLDITKFSNFIEKHDYNFCFVNDGSTDDTIEICSSLTANFPEKVFFVDMKVNMGKAEAVRQGVFNSMNKDKYEIVGYLDADLATPLEEIPYLLSFFENGYNVIIGSRVQRLGAHIERILLRHYMGRIFATLSSYMLGMKVYDSQCGAKFFEIDILQDLFKEAFISKWLFDLELLYRLKINNPEEFKTKILEVPLMNWKEQKGSRIRFKDILMAPFELLKIERSAKLRVSETSKTSSD